MPRVIALTGLSCVFALALALVPLSAPKVARASAAELQESFHRQYEAFVGGPVAPDGTEVQLDLPKALHLTNCGGSDGAGLCVFTSVNHTAYWQNIAILFDFQQWMRRFPGGGYPSKLTRMVARYAQEQGLPVPDLINVENRDLEILVLACKTGRMCGVTYSFSPTGRYGGRRISHMVSLAAARVGPAKLWAIIDNNYPGTFEFMSEAQFLATYTGGPDSQGWAAIFTWPGPPPVPRGV